jgi:hypothetical protein
VGRPIALLAAVVFCCTLVASASASASAAAGPRPDQHLTLFADSSGASLGWDSTAKRIVEHGNRVLFELHPCGRLVQPGCITPPPPSVLSVVRELGRRIGPTVVVFVGYNDNPATYRDGMPSVLRAMRNHGVKHVVWLTLRAVYKQYVDINHAIYAAKQKWPIMTVLDWNRYSAAHSSWFSGDGIHMTGTGAIAYATYLHRSPKRLGLTGPALTG